MVNPIAPRPDADKDKAPYRLTVTHGKQNLSTSGKRRIAAVFAGLGIGVLRKWQVIERERFELVEWVDQREFHLYFDAVWACWSGGQVKGSRRSGQQLGQLGRRHRQANGGSTNVSARNADEPSFGIDHGTPAVARIDRAVDLYSGDLSGAVKAQAGYRSPVDGDFRVAAFGRQEAAEREAEDMHRHRLDELALAGISIGLG